MSWLFGRLPLNVSIPRSTVEGISLNGQQLAILWETDSANHVILFSPSDMAAAELHGRLTGKG